MWNVASTLLLVTDGRGFARSVYSSTKSVAQAYVRFNSGVRQK